MSFAFGGYRRLSFTVVVKVALPPRDFVLFQRTRCVVKDDVDLVDNKLFSFEQ